MTEISRKLHMVILFCILRLSYQQELSVAISDLQDPMTFNGWSVLSNGVVNQYQTPAQNCNQNLLILNHLPYIYQKTFTITDKEYDSLYLEMDLYFMVFSPSRIKIYINSNLVFKQKFSTSYIRQNAICGNSDSQYTIYQKFNSQQTSLNLEIQFIATLANSNLGIRNLNIYSNGYKLSNGCTMDMPFLQGTQCVSYCQNSNAYLGGDNMLVCQSGVTGQSGLIGSYLTNQAFVWKFTNPSPSAQENVYLTSSFYLLNNNIYNNIMYSELFTSQFQSATQYYYITQSIQQDHFKLQISFLFYILGDWDDGSQVGLYIIGDTIYQNNMVRIFKQMGKYSSSTGSGIYYTKITSPAGPIITVRRTLITFQANFYSSTVKIGFSQQLLGNAAKYGFGNVYVYQLSNDPKIVLSGLYGLPYKCIANYYAYNGYCTQNCPRYAFKDSVNNNCTDYSQQYTTIFSNMVTQNYYGSYIIKEFYNNNFNQDNINALFRIVPAPIKNYQNGQPYSFVGNKKILGGYNSWGWGSYGAILNLPNHDQIRIQFTLYLIDSWSGIDSFSYYYDGQIGNTYLQNNPTLQLQGFNNLYQQFQESKLIIHTKSTLTLIFTCRNSHQDSMLGSCGISDLYVLVDQNVNIICPSLTQYFSYFTNNCENCVINECQLYPANTPVPYIKCSAGCLYCSSDTVCNTCDTNSGYQKVGNVCLCQSGYVQQTTCNKCHYSCQECTGTSSNQCSQCESTRLLQSGVCQCQNGRVDVFSQSQCEPINSLSSYCHYSCATCFSTEYYHCLTCPGGSNRTFKDWNSCPCDSQYVDVGVTICALIICDSSCLTCNGPQESNCLSCASNFRLELGYCVCDGLFNNIISPQNCVSNSITCDQTCLTCFNTSPQECISCDSTLHRFLDINEATNQYQCSCYDGYYEATSICQQCDQTCLTCINSASNCNQCDSNKNRQINNINQCLCIAGYNDKLNPGQQCVQNLSVCHYSCTTCFGQQSNQCLTCDSTYRVLNNTTCDCLPQQFDGGLVQCQNCYQTCLSCIGSSMNDCLTCDISQHRVLQSNQCNCITGYNNKLNIYSCQEDMTICYQTCFTCYGINQNQCLTCSIDRTLQGSTCPCQSSYFEQSFICQLCHYSCLTCTNQSPNGCNTCDTSNFRQKNNNLCSCISGYVDLGNPSCQACPNDCNDCDAQLNCISCKVANQSVSNLGRCQCSDGYLQQGSQCLSCHYSCSNCFGLLNSQCTQCDQLQFRKLSVTICQCYDGYQENEIGQCVDCQSEQGKLIFSCQYKNAEDGVWTYGESCDDGNSDPRDGCNNFQITNNYTCSNLLNKPSICYKCPDNCQKCQQQEDQITCISCIEQYYNAQNECILCYEESCLECIKPSYCSVCMNKKVPVLGRCNTCEYGYYQVDNQCISICGDGIKTIVEKCDDGNLLQSDGCSDKCEIEDNFICETINNNSHCFVHEQPQLIYEVSKQQNSEQKRILISVSQKVTYGDIQIELIEQPNIKKQFVISGKDNLLIDLKLTFSQSYNSITINVLIDGIILNQYNQSIKNNKLQIILRDIIVLSDQEQQTSQQISFISQGVVIGLFCLSTTTLLMGGVSQFVSFLNLIQQLQYIQYVNINFPPHLMQFLNIFNGFSFAPIFELFSIQQKLPQVDPQQEMFLSNGLNAYYLANMQGFLFSLLILFIIYILSNLSLYLIGKIQQHLERRQIAKYNIYCKLNKMQLQLHRTQNAIRNDGISQLIFTASYDIQFAIFLQLNNQSYDNFNLIINNQFAILNQILYFKFMGNKIKNDEIINRRRQSFYQQVKLMAALLFIFAIVQLQNFPQSQVLIISFTSLLVSIYIFVVWPFKNILRNHQLIIQEMSLFIASITFIAYVYFPESIDPIILGWFHIITFLTMIVGNMLIDLYSFVINIKKIYFK